MKQGQELAHPDTFEQTVKVARSGLANAEHRAYEAGLVSLGRFAGASESYGNNDDEDPASPDAVWIFNDSRWVSWEAKSEAQPTGSVGPNDVRQAQSHLRTVESERGAAAPSDSFSLLMSPKPSVMPQARAVAEDHIHLVRPPQVLDIFDRLVRAWRTARSRNINSLTLAELAALFHAERALPSQWMAELRSNPFKERT
ncbi:hypothetical protein [Streptomyces sp. NPDC047990]|uniref:hypothetical protein n=1 Tax=Streptomyces sp. NPDC047990 TaxID=3365496 RepID=UPI003724A7BC